MFRTPHTLTDGEKRCLEPYWEETKGQPVRKNLIKLVRHINMFNPVPDENSWEYIFFNRQLTDPQIDFALKMKHRHEYTIPELAAEENMSIEDTAQMVYDWLKPDMPKLSLGTVYRNLHQMAEEGRLMELDGPTARFDGNVRPHTHLRCLRCTQVVDVDLPYDSSLDRAVEFKGWRIHDHSLMFTGICPACAGNNEI